MQGYSSSQSTCTQLLHIAGHDGAAVLAPLDADGLHHPKSCPEPISHQPLSVPCADSMSIGLTTAKRV